MGLLGEPHPLNLGLFVDGTDPAPKGYAGVSIRGVRRWVEGMACDEPVYTKGMTNEEAWLGRPVHGRQPPMTSLKGSFLHAAKKFERMEDGLELDQLP